MRAVVRFNGLPYDMNILAARQALVRRQVAGEFHQMQELAKAVGYSRSTCSRWFAGKSTSVSTTLALLGKLQLRFEDVYKPVPELPPD